MNFGVWHRRKISVFLPLRYSVKSILIFHEFLLFLKAEIYPNKKFRAPEIAKMAFFVFTIFKIDFTQNQSGTVLKTLNICSHVRYFVKPFIRGKKVGFREFLPKFNVSKIPQFPHCVTLSCIINYLYISFIKIHGICIFDCCTFIFVSFGNETLTWRCPTEINFVKII